jgi:hypothetical protein
MAVASDGGIGTFDSGQQHRELVTTEAGDGVADARYFAQPHRHLLQHLVAGPMTERVVDGLETVEVDQEHANARVSRQGGFDVTLEQPPVGQAGERIVHGQMLVLGDVPAKVVDDAAVSTAMATWLATVRNRRRSTCRTAGACRCDRRRRAFLASRRRGR